MSNVYLNIFDQYMKRVLRCKYYGRYVDDAYVISSDRDFLLSLIPKVTVFLREKLGLSLHHGKLTIREARKGVEYLGGFILPYRTYISRNTIRRIYDGIEKMDYTDREKVLPVVNSYLGVLSHYSSYNIRCNLFLKEKLLKVSSFDKGINKMIV